MIEFKYKEESLGPSRGKVKRPIADVFLQTISKSWIEFHPYIDSGADVTMIPLSLGRLIGLHIDENRVEQIGGIKGSVPVVYSNTLMRIGSSSKFSCRIACSLIEDVPPLLGREGVFDMFTITFRQSKGIVIFEAK